MNTSDKLYIQLFQDFIIYYHEEAIHMSDYLSKQTLSLFETLILNYGKSVSKEQLIELMWSNNENPDSALKFNIFRLRKLLNEIPVLAELEMIQTDKNGYRFAPGIPCESDVALYEGIHRDLDKKKNLKQEDYDTMNHLLELYKGRLFHVNSTLWFMQIERYLANTYARFFSPLCEYYLKTHEYVEIQRIAQKAVALDPSVESHHYYQILAYFKQEEFSMAYESYQNAIEQLSDEFEYKPSKRMLELYHQITSESNQKFNPEEVMSYYKTREFDEGAFYCTSAVFDQLYEMRLRSAKRDEMNLYLFVFDLDNNNDEALDESMRKLKSCIVACLRGSDAFTKLNRSQYLVLLSCPNQDNAFSIAMRVSASYRKKIDHKNNSLHYHLSKVNK